MQHITADGDDEPFESPLAPTNRQRVEQRLGWMLMRSIAGVDHRCIEFLRQEVRRAGLVMPHHQQVAVTRVLGRGLIWEALALVHGRGGDRHIYYVRAKPLARDLEAGAGAGRVLEEQ